MKLGDSGERVSSLQRALTKVGYPLKVDGEFGPFTENAVMAMQAAHGLVVDGIVGHLTLVKLDQLEAALPKSPTPVPPGMPTVPGLDVSNWDKASNWGAIAASGYKFGIIKCTEGLSFKNIYFAQDFKNAKVAGLYRGGYHFFHPDRDARSQANFYLSCLGGLFPNDLPPILDLEQMNGTQPAAVIAAALVFMNQVRAVTKKQPILYTDPDILNQLGHPQAFKEFPLWLAAPGHTLSMKCPPPWSKITILQDSFKGKVPGVHGDADLNVFNGTMAELDAFAKASR